MPLPIKQRTTLQWSRADVTKRVRIQVQRWKIS
jgi:hypothetical protein